MTWKSVTGCFHSCGKAGKSIAELAEALGLTQVTIIADFRLLAAEKLVYREKEKNIHYSPYFIYLTPAGRKRAEEIERSKAEPEPEPPKVEQYTGPRYSCGCPVKFYSPNLCIKHWQRAKNGERYALVKEELRDIMGIEAEPVLTRVYRWRRSMPQYTIGHDERVKWIDERVGGNHGLYLTGSAYHGIGISDSIRYGEVVAKKIIHQFEKG